MKMKCATLFALLVVITMVFASVPGWAQAKGSGQYTVSVPGFAPITIGAATCQPGPGILFPPCDLSSLLQLGVPLTLNIVNAKAPVTCTVSAGTLPAGWTLAPAATGTGCVITAMTAAQASFTVAFVGS